MGKYDFMSANAIAKEKLDTSSQQYDFADELYNEQIKSEQTVNKYDFASELFTQQEQKPIQPYNRMRDTLKQHKED